MMTSYRITSVEYYLSDEARAQAAGRASARDRAAYYVDNGTEAGETDAVWWCPQGGGGLVERGGAVDSRAFRTLAAGCDPATGEVLVVSNRTDRLERTAGYDMQFSAPKSVSALWALADIQGDRRAAEILSIQQEAMVEALDWAQTQGLIVTRRGSGSKGTLEYVPVADVAAAMFLHTTSRAGDPQIHGHCVLANVSIGPDGQARGIDNARMLEYQGAMGAVYRAALAERLQQRLGLAIERQDRGFEVAGVPEELRAAWSKRRQAIEAVAEAEGYETATNRARAQVAALVTRDAKEKVPPRDELRERWRDEAAAVGWTADNVWQASLAAGREQRDSRRDSHGLVTLAAEAAVTDLMATQAVIESRHLFQRVGERLVGLGGVADIQVAIDKLLADGKLVRLTADVGTAEDAAERAALTKERVQTELKVGHLAPAFTTPEMIVLERQMILDAIDRRGEVRIVSEATVERAIARRRGVVSDGQAAAIVDALTVGVIDLSPDRVGQAVRVASLDKKQADALGKLVAERLALANGTPPADVAAVRDLLAPLKGMSDEQANLVRHVLGGDGVTISSAPPGAGKSFSLGAVAEAARADGANVFTIAPSWKATSVVRADTETAQEMAAAVNGFLNRLNPAHREHIALDGRSIVIVDEAGMVPTREMAALLAHARASGAKVILSGDAKQLAPVGAGAAMAVLERQLGSAKMAEIRRQKVAWMRAASTDLHQGRADRALEAYDRAGLVEWSADRQHAIDALVADWRADVEARPEADLGKARIAMAFANADIRVLNEAMRAECRDMGRLNGADITVSAFRRGDGKLVELSLAVGDRLIFGERVEINGRRVDNSDCGTVESVHGDAPDPQVRIRLDKGLTVEGRWSQLVGHRDKDAGPNERHPKVQHAYAVSIHAAQGQTVDRAYLLNTGGLKSQSMLVGMTRHRDLARMYVDTAPVYDRLESRIAGRSIVMQRGKRGISTPDAPAGNATDDPLDRSGIVTIEDVKQQVFRASMEAEDKRNVSDYVTDPTRWARGREMAAWERPAAPSATVAAPKDEGTVSVGDIELAVAALDEARGQDTDRVVGVAKPSRLFPTHPLSQPTFPVSDGWVNRLGADVDGVPTAAQTTIPTAKESIPPFGFRRPFVRPPGMVGADVKERMENRAQGPLYALPDRAPSNVGAPHRQGATEGRQQADHDELDRFGREVDLRALAVKYGWKNASMRRASEVGADPRAGSWLLEKAGQEVVISAPGATKHGAAYWSWWPVGGGKGEGGGCVTFVQFDRGWGRGTLGRVRQELRAFLGAPEPTHSRNLADTIRADLQALADLVPRARDYGPVRAAWHRLKSGISSYLLGRGIDEETQRHFAGDIRVGENGHGKPFAAFATRAADVAIIGVEMKGPKNHPLDERSWSHVEKSGERGITRMGERTRPTRIYVGEAVIDLLTAWQRDGRPAGALLCATGGTFTERAGRELAELAERNPDSRIYVVVDNDDPKIRIDWRNGTVTRQEPPGDLFATAVDRAVRLRMPDASIVRRRPPAQFKDFNDWSRGITKADSAMTLRETLARCEAPDASPADRSRAAEVRGREWYRQQAHLLYDAEQAGRMSAAEVRANIAVMATAKESRGGAEHPVTGDNVHGEAERLAARASWEAKKEQAVVGWKMQASPPSEPDCGRGPHR